MLSGVSAAFRKWLSPAGFLLALVLFLLLPTVTVSCSLPDGSAEGPGELSVSATGTELVGGATPALEASGAFAVDEYQADSLLAGDLAAGAAPGAVQALAIGLLVVLVAGAGLGLWQRRPALTIAAAAFGGVLVVLVENAMAARWRPIVSGYGALVGELPDAGGRDVAREAASAVGAGIGFWFSLVGLAVAGIAAIPALRRKQTGD